SYSSLGTSVTTHSYDRWTFVSVIGKDQTKCGYRLDKTQNNAISDQECGGKKADFNLQDAVAMWNGGPSLKPRSAVKTKPSEDPFDDSRLKGAPNAHVESP